MTWIQGVITSIIAAWILAVIGWVYRGHFGQQIKITRPRDTEMLTEPEPLGQGCSFPVHGTYKTLPDDHEIWLLTQDQSNGTVRPQGFFSVQYDRQQRTWTGKINEAAGRRS